MSENKPLLKTVRQSDVFPKLPNSDVLFEDRLTGKSIIVDNNHDIALVGTTVNYIYTLPGGGIDVNESIEEGIIREAKEETGCTVKLDSILGVIEDYRNRDKKHCISYCGLAHVIQKGEPELIEYEKKNGLHVKWVSVEEAFSILSEEIQRVREGKIDFYNTAYNIVRDYEFLSYFINNKARN
jgi:ADP-ribose pyrophosphatase YjhB (NUDIX family)